MEKKDDVLVLIVDDEKTMCTLLQRILDKAGYESRVAMSGEEALECLAREVFSVVLCDINLPGISGLEVLRQGRQRPADPAFVMVTALSDRETALLALQRGACGYIVKPFTAEEVQIQLEIALHLRTMEIESSLTRQELEELVAERTAELSRKIEEQKETEESLFVALQKVKEVEEENRLALNHLQTIIQSIPYPFYVVDVSNYQLVMANTAASPDGSWVGQTCHALTHQRDTPCRCEEHCCPLQEVVRTGKPVVVEHLHRRPDGSEAWFEVHGNPLFDMGGKVVQLIEFSIDIDERKKAEHALRESEQRQRAILDAVQTGVLLIDPEDHRIVESNPAACRMFGAEREEVVGQVCHRFICPAEQEKCPVTDLGQKVDNSERVLLTRDGRKLPILKTVASVTLGDRSYLLESFVDISGQKEAEASLKQALAESRRLAAELESTYADLQATHETVLHQEKLASVGQLAAGVAHEINNPMGFITSNLSTMRKYLERLTAFLGRQQEAVDRLLPDTERTALVEERRSLKIDAMLADLPGLLDESLDGAERVRVIVQNLKNFSRGDAAVWAMADINQCLETTLSIVWNELKYKATVEKDYGELPLTFCSPQQLNQVFMNLLVNGAQAITGQGTIRIRTESHDASILVTIADTGCGMSLETCKRIFEPFFTTKEVGRGTGLGLSIAYDIVRAHHGEISVVSEPGRGTIFTVRIPVQQENGK